jgi:hypothetical protein
MTTESDTQSTLVSCTYKNYSLSLTNSKVTLVWTDPCQ